MEVEGGGVVTPRRLSSQHSTLRDTFLASDLAESVNNRSIIDEGNNNGSSLATRRPMSSLTLGDVLNSTKKSPAQNNIVVRTLLEIIRNDETLIGSGSSTSNHGGKKSWKSFKDRLKLKKGSNQNQNAHSQRWAPLSPVPQSDLLPRSRSMRAEAMNAHTSYHQAQGVDTVPSDEVSFREGGSPRNRGSFILSEALAAEREETHLRLSRDLDVGNDGENRENFESANSRNNDEEVEEEGEAQPDSSAPVNQPVRMSLMDLLEEAEQQQSGVRGPTYRFDDCEVNEEEAQEEPEEEEENIGKEVHSCCVCMVRHKGAAFIPCGHTFCRKCSRELWVQRGNCPLCNNFILEILDIF